MFSYFKKKKEGGNGSNPFLIKENLSGKLSIKDGREKSWIEENVNFSSKSKDNFFGPTEFIGKALNLKRINLFLGVIFLLIFCLTAKIFYLQIVKGSHYREVAEENRIRIEIIDAQRGVIYDRNFTPLVRNVPSFSLYMIPGDFPGEDDKKEEIIAYLSEIIEIDTDDFRKKINEVSPFSYTPVFLKENIGYEEALRLKIESNDLLAGINIRLEGRREYLNKDTQEYLSMSHILGYVGKINEKELESNEEYSPVDFIGKTGLESVYENILRGESGKKRVEVDALGREKNVIAEEAAIDGKNIILTLDIEIQKKLEEIVQRYLTLQNKKKASAIVLDPNNGRILGLVSLPSFDNNFFAQGITPEQYQELINNPDNPLFNRSVMGEYPSGSTIKPVVAAAALEEGVINRNTSFLSVGGIRIGQWFFPDWRFGGHGLTNVTKAIAESVNTFFYIIGGGYENINGLGVKRITEYAKKFGFGERLGIDLPNEAEGFLPSKEWKEEAKGERWYIGDTYHLAIGQGDISATPLQIASATAVFANNGTLFRPHFLGAIESPKPVDEEQYVLNRDFISKENLEIIREGMRRTVTSGSARKLLVLPVTSAGKTGTAQWNTNKDPHAWFTAFAPYKNPEVVVTVLVEEGKEGSAISLDITRDFLNWYFTKK